MIHGIPFAVPAKFSADMANGAVYRIGALLKEQGTGKIVAHVQETGMAQQHGETVLNDLPKGPIPWNRIFSHAQIIEYQAYVTRQSSDG